jgi:hypothetical protein
MGFWSKLAGTLEDWFRFNDDDIAIGKNVGGHMVFKDKVVSGTKTLSDLLAGGTAFDVDTILTDENGAVMVDEDGNVMVEE